MKRVALPMVLATIAVGVFIAAKPAQSADKTSKLVERGDYLATTMGCKDCHTPGFFYGAPDSTRELSGSEIGWQGPWGVSYSKNLTPDPETGLGKWADADIAKALRTGVRPDGSRLLPPMPWQNFSSVPDDDMKALIAYLRSITPVKHEEPKNLPPGAKATGAVVMIPAPPAWDAPRKAGTQPPPETKARAAEEHDKDQHDKKQYEQKH
jgi:hypothetical protein